MRLPVITVLLLVALLVSGCGSAASPAATAIPTQRSLTKVTLAMGYIPNIQFAPFYVAKERGYFADEGIDVDFDYGMESDLIKDVGTGKRLFAIAGGIQAMLGRAQGIPVVYAATMYQKFPVAVISLESKPVKSPADLKGRTIGLPGLFGDSYWGLKAILYANKIDESQLNLKPIGFNQVPQLVQGQVDAIVGYLNNDAVLLRQQGKQVVTLPVYDYFDLISNGIITNEDTISKHPELVRGMVKAFLRGMQDTLDKPDDAFNISLKYIPEAGGENKTAQMEVLNQTLPLWQSDYSKANGLGMSNPQAWQKTEEFLVDARLLEKPIDVNKAYTNAFVK